MPCVAGPIPIERRDDFLKAVAAQLGDAEVRPWRALYRVARDEQRQFLNGVPRDPRFHSKYR